MSKYGFAVQIIPDKYNPTDRQREIMAKVGNAEDFVVFNHLIRRGMLMREGRLEQGCYNGARMRLKEVGDYYFTAAQALRMLQNDRSWEDWFPWVVFRNQHLGHKIDWIEWAVERYGADYETFDLNSLMKEWREWQAAEAAKVPERDIMVV